MTPKKSQMQILEEARQAGIKLGSNFSVFDDQQKRNQKIMREFNAFKKKHEDGFKEHPEKEIARKFLEGYMLAMEDDLPDV